MNFWNLILWKLGTVFNGLQEKRLDVNHLDRHSAWKNRPYLPCRPSSLSPDQIYWQLFPLSLKLIVRMNKTDRLLSMENNGLFDVDKKGGGNWNLKAERRKGSWCDSHNCLNIFFAISWASYDVCEIRYAWNQHCLCFGMLSRRSSFLSGFVFTTWKRIRSFIVSGNLPVWVTKWCQQQVWLLILSNW